MGQSIIKRGRHLAPEPEAARLPPARLTHLNGPLAERTHAWVVRFQRLMRQIEAVPYEFDVTHGRFAFVGEGASALNGDLPTAWCDTAYWPDCIHADDRERVIAAYASLTCAPADLIYRVMTSSGGSVWVEDRGYPLLVGGDLRGRMGFLSPAPGGAGNANAVSQLDALTGVLDRAAFLKECAGFLDAVGRRGLRAAMIVLDLDEFNVINEMHGTRCGDAVLRELARRLSRSARVDGMLGRTGADEFVLLLPLPAGDGALQRVLAEVHATVTTRMELDDAEIYPRASLGVSLYPTDALSPEVLVEHAAASLGEARRKGGGGAEFYSREVSSRMAERVRLETRLHHALARDEFVLHFQPQIDLGSGLVVGMEALLRWDDPQQGLLMPVSFISALEQNRLMLQVGNWVICKALGCLASLREQGVAAVPVAVNVTAQQLATTDLVEQVERALAEHSIPPELLELEITESAWLERDRVTRDSLFRLRELGVGLALDDFGTGYSSLAYLRDLPVSTLKIDQAFISGLPHYRRDLGIVEAIHTLARHLELRVIAEGIESRAQLQCVARMGSHAAQGFYFARPIPEAALPEALNRAYHLW